MIDLKSKPLIHYTLSKYCFDFTLTMFSAISPDMSA